MQMQSSAITDVAARSATVYTVPFSLQKLSGKGAVTKVRVRISNLRLSADRPVIFNGSRIIKRLSNLPLLSYSCVMQHLDTVRFSGPGISRAAPLIRLVEDCCSITAHILAVSTLVAVRLLCVRNGLLT